VKYKENGYKPRRIKTQEIEEWTATEKKQKSRNSIEIVVYIVSRRRLFFKRWYTTWRDVRVAKFTNETHCHSDSVGLLSWIWRITISRTTELLNWLWGKNDACCHSSHQTAPRNECSTPGVKKKDAIIVAILLHVFYYLRQIFTDFENSFLSTNWINITPFSDCLMHISIELRWASGRSLANRGHGEKTKWSILQQSRLCFGVLNDKAVAGLPGLVPVHLPRSHSADAVTVVGANFEYFTFTK